MNKETRLSDSVFKSYLAELTDEQAASITALRSLVLQTAPTLHESIDDGKWFGGLLTYNQPSGRFVFALGPRANGMTTFHMMPFYESKVLQERHGPLLKRYLSGKSCIKFKKYSDLPQESLIAIITSSNEISV